MDCARARQLADLYLDGTLEGAELDELRAHLDRCPRCRAHVTAGERMLGALPEATASDASSELVDRIMAAVKRDVRRRRGRGRWIGATLGVLGAAAAALVAAVLLRPPTPSQKPKAQPSLELVGTTLDWVRQGVDLTSRTPGRLLEPVEGWVEGLGEAGESTSRTTEAAPESGPLAWAAQAGRGLIDELTTLGSPVLEPLTLLPMPPGKAESAPRRPPKRS